MSVNKITILKSSLNQEVVIPIEMTWDYLDRSDSLIPYENQAIKEAINQKKDFDVARFSYAGAYDNQYNILNTDINYVFNFVPSGATVYTASWSPSYITQGFTPSDVYYYNNSFKKSFFKLDLYDSPESKKQTNYITIIIPTQQGLTTPTLVGYETKNIKTPQFKLDFLGDKEGYFIYWLKNRSVLDITTFYMSAKFFDAKTGVFIKMMNRPQSTIVGNKFNFPQEKYFYYKVNLSYTTLKYNVYDIATGVDVSVGNTTNPINWYEYINPQ
jgi:hypothetical protein